MKQKLTAMAASMVLFASGAAWGTNYRMAESSSVMSPLDRMAKPAGALVAGSGRDASSLPVIYGWNVYSRNETPYGLYRMHDGGFDMVWADSFMGEKEAKLYNGILKDGKLVGLAVKEFMTYKLGYYNVVFDFETGEILESKELKLNVDPYYERMAYNPEDGYVYGVGNNYQDGGKSLVFMRSDPSDFTTSEVIAEIGAGKNLQSMCYCGRDNAFYGANIAGEFVRIDLDGTYTSLFTLDSDFVPAFIGGILFNSKDNLFYWNYSTDDSSFMATIDDIAQKVDVLFEIEHANELSFFVTTDEWVENTRQPEAPGLAEVSFPNGALGGSLVYNIPSVRMDGTPIDERLSYVATVDGSQSAQGDAVPGGTVRVDYPDMSRGSHTFGFYVVCGELTSPVCQTNMFIGYDYPKAPANVVMDRYSLRWDPVTEGENHGYIDKDNLEYSVSINGEPYATTKENHIELSLPADQPLTVFSATVVALNGGYESEEAESNKVVAGQPLTLPIYLKPTPRDYDLCTVVDGNGDGVYWIYGDRQDGFVMGYSLEGSDCDDWLFLPPFDVDDADNTLSIEYEACIRSAMFNEEEMEVMIGRNPTPGDMTQTLVEKYCPATIDPQMELKSVLFNVEEAGTYYVGFHVTSIANQMGIILRNIKIEDSIAPESPSAVTDISAVGAENGVLEAKVTLTLPKTRCDGSEIPSDTMLKAVVTSEADTAEAHGKPGETVSLTVATKQGENILKASASIGELRGPRVSVNVYTGVWAPLHTEVTSIKVSPDMMQATIEWKPVTEGVDGKFIVPEDVIYDIYVVEAGPLGQEWVYYDTAGKETEYTYICPEGMAQQVLQIGVVAVNAAGNDGYVASARELVGTPLGLPMADSFGNSEAAVEPWVIYALSNAYDARWAIGKIENLGVFDTDAEYGLYCIAKKDGSKGMIGFPRFSTVGCKNVKIVFDAYVGEDCVDAKVTAAGHYSTERVVVGTISPMDGSPNMRRVEMQLPAELLDQYWVQVYLEVEYDDVSKILLVTNVSVEEGVVGSSESVDMSVRSIRGGMGTVEVTGYAGETLRISAADGLCVMSAVVRDDSEVYDLPRGIYIITAGTTTRKVVVR